MAGCDAKIRPFPNDVEIQCDGQHVAITSGDEIEHAGRIRDYAYRGSSTVITWYESDRRTFRGDWMECPQLGCILPAGHSRKHAQ